MSSVSYGAANGSVTTAAGGGWTNTYAPDLNEELAKIFATPVLTIGTQTIWSTERAFAVSGCISEADAGAGSTYTVGITAACIDAALLATDSVSADELNATGVESELEAVIDLQDLQGTLTVAKGGTGSAPASDDQALVSDSSAAATWRSIPDCDQAADTLNYDTTTNAFSCGADAGAGGGLTAADIDTSDEIAAIVGDETGSGALVFGTAPDLTISATTETNIESAIDTLANLTSIQGVTTTLVDGGAGDVFWGLDDSANAYENLTKAEAQAILGLLSSTTDNQIVRYDSTAGNQQGSALVIADTSGAISGAASGFSIEFFGAAGTDSTLTAPSAGDLNIEGNRIYRAGGTDVAVADGGTGASALTDLIALTTHTTGNYVKDVADGTGIDGTAAGEGATYTPTLDLTEINTFTLGAGAATGIIFDAGATDPAIEVASGSITIDIGGTNETTLTATAFSPGVNDGNALGETSTPLRWADLFMADGGVIDIGTTASRATITHTAASDSITIAADPDNATASSAVNLSVDNATEATLNSTNFSPGANDGNALGVSGTAWADLFLASGGLIEFDGGTTNTFTCTGGNCTIEGNGLYRAGGTDVALADGGTAASLADPGGNRIMAWDDTANAVEFQDAGTGLTAGTSTLDCDTPTESAVGCIELATTAEAEAGTDTARAVTAAGLLASFSGAKTISVPGGSLIPATTAASTAATLESATNKIVQRICGFTSTAADEFGWFQIAMPKGWNESTITGQFYWTAASGTGDVVWSLACLARSDDDAIDTALGTAVTVTDTLTATGDLMISAATAAVTIGGTPAENDEIFCRVARVGTNGSDTFSGTAQLSAVKVIYTTNAMTDD